MVVERLRKGQTMRRSSHYGTCSPALVLYSPILFAIQASKKRKQRRVYSWYWLLDSKKKYILFLGIHQ